MGNTREFRFTHSRLGNVLENKKNGQNLGFTLEIYWKRNCLTTDNQFVPCFIHPNNNNSVYNRQTKKDERHRDKLITWIWICKFFVEVVQVNVTWISSDDGDQYSITREEIHDNNRILVGSFYPKVQHKYSQKHYHTILFVNILHKTCSWSTTWRQHEESRVICCIIVHYTFCSIYILENWKKTWKSPGISYLEKSGNPVLHTSGIGQPAYLPDCFWKETWLESVL